LTGLVGALEIGGTHVSVGRVDLEARQLDRSGVRRFGFAADAPRDDLLVTIKEAARAGTLAEIARWGVAVPGPFDYTRGIVKIRGQGKLDALYDVDLREVLTPAVGLGPETIRFLNDAHAFLLGEWWAGAARGHARAMGVTLGTGLGSAFLVNGRAVHSGAEVPLDARLDLVPFHGRPVEERISARGIRAAYGASPREDVGKIAYRARQGEPGATLVFRSFGSELGEFLQPWLQRFAPSCLLFGGSISRAWDLFVADFIHACPDANRLARCSPADHLEEAPLFGAALHAHTAAEPMPK
jgi:glucokinase